LRADIASSGGSVLLKRFYHEGLAQASYLVGCERTGEAAVIDANRDFEQYVAAAADHRLRLTHVTETHIHADYLSGSAELAARTGARLLLSGEGGSDWQYAFARDAGASLLHDGEEFMVGHVRIEVMHTPGHTPEHLTFIVSDTIASERPIGALTGDFIFVGDVGRPDLLERAAGVEGTMRAGAKLLFESLRRFTEHLPDYLQIWPGHGAGSACGKSLGAVPQTTLGYEKLVNWAFQIDDETRFVDAVLEGQPDPPRYFATMKRMNRDGPARRPDAAVSRRHGAELADALRRGDVIVDIRSAPAFAQGFIPGSINIPLNRGFVGYAGWLLPYDRDVHLLTSDSDDAAVRQAVAELRMIGVDRIAGWFGVEAFDEWRAAGNTLGTVERITPQELASRMESRAATVVDVRSAQEYADSHIAGTILIPMGHLTGAARDLARDRPVVLLCHTGSRSAIGASVLAAEGFASVANMAGGMAEWERAGLPTERGIPAFTTT
jgi:hydroxyacylglutathione hydrolase